MFKAKLATLAVLVLSGCAVGNKYIYTTNANLSFAGSDTVAVAVSDEREYIRSGNKTPNFVGLQRGGYGNPFDVTTASGKSLAQDMTATIVSSLIVKGFNASGLPADTQRSMVETKNQLLATSANKRLLLILSEWKSDTMVNVALKYDVTVAVFDRDGRLIGRNELQGSDDLGGNYWNAPSHAKKAVPDGFKAKLEALLNAPEIANALK